MTMTLPPLVSICIPTYKGAQFLGATIDSVLKQDYPNIELWILDDQSPDQTESLVKTYRDPRLHYTRNQINLGPEGNWNHCLDHAKGKYFKLLPHDDILAPNALKDQVAVLEADAKHEVALVFGYREIIDSKGKTLMRRGLSRTKAGRISSQDLARRCVRAGTNLIGEPGNGLFRSELIGKVGPYDASFPYLVDLDYWFRILGHGDAYYLGSHTSSFRVSAGSWSVALGSKQFDDFQGLVKKFANQSRFRFSPSDKLLGAAQAKINMIARALIYRFVH